MGISPKYPVFFVHSAIERHKPLFIPRGSAPNKAPLCKGGCPPPGGLGDWSPRLHSLPGSGVLAPSDEGAVGAADGGRDPRRRRGLTYLCGQRPRFFLPQGEALSAPHSLLFPTAHSAAGAPFYFIDSGRPTQGLPASDAALAARPRWAVAASPPKRERAAWRSKRKAPGGLRPSATEEGRTCPLDPGKLGEGASRKTSWGVGARFGFM